MGKKNKSVTKDIAQVDTKPPPAYVKKSNTRSIKNVWIKIALVTAVLLMYGKTVNYDFTIDDNIFYVKHNSVQKGISGIPEIFMYGSLEKYNGMKGLQPYRPVTLTSFAVQKQIFNNGAAKAHFVNILLYVLLVLVLFNVLLKLLPEVHPLICATIVLLFAVHPVHTEVVASVKSQDELLSVLFGLLALSYAATLIKADKFSVKYFVLSIGCYGLALLSKEGVFAMLLIFPLAFWLLLSQSIKRSLVYALPYLGAGLLFLFARHLVLDGQVQNYQNTIMENVLYGAKGFAQITATKMEILFHYQRLFFVPWPLSWDYSYNEVPVVNWASFTAWASLMLYGGMLVFAVFKIKKQPVISFGILFFLITLAPTANLFFLNGSTVSERFLFFPSLGLIIALVYAAARLLKIDTLNFTGTAVNKFKWIFGTVILLFVCLSFIRSSDWESNFTIYKAGAQNAPNSSRTNLSFGNQYLKLGDSETNRQAKIEYYNDALKYLKKSTDILPSNKDALYGIALCYASLGDKAKAYESYQHALIYYPKHRSVLNNLGTAFFEEKKYDSAYMYFKRCYDADSSFPKSSQNLAIYYFTMGDFNLAIQYASNAIKLFKYQVLSYDILSKAYKAIGNNAEASKYQMLYIEMKAEADDAAPGTNYIMER